MRAVRVHDAGSSASLRVDEVPEPREPRDEELLVAVAASSVNGTDVAVARGDLPLSALRRGPRSLGFDLAGEVVAVGEAVTAFEVGDAVVALLGHGGGAQAELALVDSASAAFAPDSVAWTAAAALPLAGLTALQALHGRAALGSRPEASVLVVGAAGGIGSFGVQLAAIAGAHVTAVVDAAREDYVRGLGADEVVDRRQRLGALGARFDVVLDAPGILSPDVARALLRPGGTAVTTRPQPTTLISSVGSGLVKDVMGTLGALGAPVGAGAPGAAGERPGHTAVMTAPRTRDLDRLLRLVEDGRLRVPVDDVLPLADVAAAHARTTSGDVRGKVVLTL